MAQLSFNANTVEPSTGQVDPMPTGWYNAKIDESKIEPTKDGLGTKLVLRFSVIDGKYANRKVFVNLNIQNQNPVAQEIAYKDLSAICHSIGVFNMEQTEQLHGIPMKVRVKLVPARDGYDARNDISAYRNINEQVEMADTGAGAPQGAPAGFGGQPGFAQPQAAPQQAAQQPWAQQQAAQQPWAQQQAPAQPQQAAPQQAPVQQLQQAPQGQPWQQAPQQPWAQQNPSQAVPQQAAPAQPQTTAPQQAAPTAQPEQQYQQPQQAAPAATPAQGGMPPWAQPQQ